MSEDRKLLLSFIASLTLADHLGDVGNDIQTVLYRLGITEPWDELDELGNILSKMGVKTLHGTELSSDDEDNE